ncbi:hypothetical protein QFC19_003193 [Naganishia cerealis]|uniref:Uncharacterized protein n=1 Tax=Naganishia cerealis TaxID=610337 RepID=A0ACC2W429_9TREE|nr:hypothetical protein QFC19_003193 [Naganishia cerealis]
MTEAEPHPHKYISIPPQLAPRDPDGLLYGSVDSQLLDGQVAKSTPQIALSSSFANAIPTFILHEEDLGDPMNFVETHKEAGKQFGAIKVVVPNELRSKIGAPTTLSPDTIEFNTTQLRCTTMKQEIHKRVQFVNDLFTFYRGKEAEKSEPSTEKPKPDQIPEPLKVPEMPAEPAKETTSEPPEQAKKPLDQLEPLEPVKILDPLSEQMGSSQEPKLDFSAPDSSQLASAQEVKPEFSSATPASTNFAVSDLFTKLPTLVNRPIDLYLLYHCVIKRGGFQKVDLWSSIGFDMGYKPEEITKWKNELSSIYEKYLLPFEKSHFSSSNLHKRSFEETHSYLAGSSKTFKRFTRSKIAKGIPLNLPSYIKVSPTTDDEQKKILKNQLSASSQVKQAFGSITGDCVDDEVVLARSFIKGQPRNLQQLMVKDSKVQQNIIKNNQQTFLESLEISTQDFEALFWSTISQNSLEPLEIEVARQLSSFVHSPRFHRLTTHTNNDFTEKSTEKSMEAATNPWNLYNIACAPNSLLGILTDLDITTQDIYHPTTNVNMTFGFENWRCEDHFLQLCDYLHYGASKLWHFIPESEMDKFEDLLDTLNHNENVEISLKEPKLTADALEAILDPIASIADSTRYEHRSPPLENLIKKLPRKKSQRNQDYLVSPEQLKKHNIKYYTALQGPGEFIIKYPKVYSCNLSSGLNVGAEVNLATVSWLDYALVAEKWLSSQHIIPAFLLFKMLTNFANLYDNGNGKVNFDSHFFPVAENHLSNRVDTELENRELVRKMLNHPKEIVADERTSNINNWISDIDMSSAFPSKVVVTAVDLSLALTMSLQNFLDLGEQIMNNPELKAELHLYYTDDRLKAFCRSLSSYSIDYNEWMNSYREFFASSSEPNLRNIKALLAEGDKIKAAMSSSNSTLSQDGDAKKYFQALENLRNFVNRANDIVEECQIILNVKHQQRIRGGSNEDQDCEDYLSRLYLVLKLLPTLGFLSPETEQIMELKVEIENFDRAARLLISKPRATVRDFEDLIDLGMSFGLVLPSLSLLKRLKERIGWIETYETIVSGGDPFASKVDHYTLEHLVEFAALGLKVLGSNDRPMLAMVHQIINSSKEYSNGVAKIISVEYADEVDLQKLDSIINDVEARSRTKNEERLIASAEVYKQLIELRNHSSMLEKFKEVLNGMKDGIAYQYQQAKHIQKQIEGSGLKFKCTIIADSLSRCDEWISSLYQYLEKVEYPSAFHPETPNDVNVKLTLHSGLIKTCCKIHAKCKMSFDMESDNYLKSSSYQFFRGDDEDKTGETAELDTSLPETSLLEPNEPSKPAIYCLCREAEFGDMIECDACKEWYHTGCVNETDEMDDDSKYLCPMCAAVEGILQSITIKLARMLELEDFLNTANGLKAVPPNELRSLQALVDLTKSLRETFEHFLKTSEKYGKNERLGRLRFILRKVYGAPVFAEDVYVKVVDEVRKLQSEISPQVTIATESNTKQHLEKVHYELKSLDSEDKNNLVSLTDALPAQIPLQKSIELDVSDTQNFSSLNTPYLATLVPNSGSESVVSSQVMGTETSSMGHSSGVFEKNTEGYSNGNWSDSNEFEPPTSELSSLKVANVESQNQDPTSQDVDLGNITANKEMNIDEKLLIKESHLSTENVQEAQKCVKMNGINAHDSDNLERNQESQNTLNKSLDTNNTQDTIPTTTNNSIEQKMVDALAPVLGKEATFE